VSRPPLLPGLLRTDGSNAFARYSMQVRVPRIARDVIDAGGWPARVAEAVERLATDIEGDAPVPPPSPPGPDVEAWTRDHEAHAGQTWLGAEWFYAELAFYREVARACRFWETGRDPFDRAKDEELAGDRPWHRLGAALAAGGPRDERVLRLLDDGLWGNRVDLSYSVAASRGRADDDLLVDERAAALPLLTRAGAHVHLVADNTGTELACDMALAGALLEDPAARVTVHVKMQPIFVSDATARDVRRLLDAMRARGGEARPLAERLDACFDEGRLALAPDPFWSSPRFLWDAPAHLARALSEATIVVVKGDANYRRVVGDALWPAATPLRDACGHLRAPALLLRTMKSDAVVGLPAGLAERLDADEPRWRIDGQRGLAQTYLP
jgi:hypothetical protein